MLCKKMPLNKLFLYILFDILIAYIIKKMNIKTNFFVLRRLFHGETKTGNTWAQVIEVLEEYTKLQFLHLSSMYLEKSAP
jgi:hypothetical protein